MNQSVSVHWSASSRVMRSSSLQPQQDTITSSVITRPLSIGWIISLVLSLITGNSIAQFEIIASFFFTFYHLFLASYCDPVSFSRAHPRRGCQALKCSSHRGQSQPSRNFPSNGSRSGAGNRQLRQVPPLPSISRAWLPHWLQGSNVVSKVIVLNFFKCHLQTSLAF